METTKCLNCEKNVPQKKGKRAKLYCSDLCRATYHQNKKRDVDKSVSTVVLPKDYLSFEKVMVLKTDGTIIPIEDLPKDSHFDLWMQAFNSLQKVVGEDGKPMFFQYKPDLEITTPVNSPVAGKTVTVRIKAKDHFIGNIPPMPTRNEGEDKFDFADRKNAWKKKYNQ